MFKAMFLHLSPLQSPKGPLLDTFSLTHPPEILLHIYLCDVSISVFYVFSTFFFLSPRANVCPLGSEMAHIENALFKTSIFKSLKYNSTRGMDQPDGPGRQWP